MQSGKYLTHVRAARVSLFLGMQYVDAAAGELHTVLIRSDGDVVTTLHDGNFQPIPTNSANHGIELLRYDETISFIQQVYVNISTSFAH